MAQSSLREANALYRAGEYQRALEGYQELVLSDDRRIARHAFLNLIQILRTRTGHGATELADVSPECKGVERMQGEVAVIVLTHNGAFLINRFFQSLRNWFPRRDVHVFVTDHASTDDTRLVLRYWQDRLPLSVYLCPRNDTFSRAINRWSSTLTGFSTLLFVNDDIVFRENVIDRMAAALSAPGVGVVGVEQLDGVDRDRRTDRRERHHLGVSFQWDEAYEFWRPYNVKRRMPGSSGKASAWYVPAVTGSVMMVGRQDFERLGGFDEQFTYGYEDVDFCLRCFEQLEKSTICLASEGVVHDDGATRRSQRGKELFFQRLKNVQHFREKFRMLPGLFDSHYQRLGQPLEEPVA
jgi:GT2 family glycosyltransferase